MKSQCIALALIASSSITPCFAQASAPQRLRACAPPDLVAEGDTIKLFVFEKLTSRDEDWAKSREAKPASGSFALRSELSGEMTVGPDGFMFLPLLGNLKAAGVTPDAVSKSVGEKFREIFGHDASVNLTIFRRKPVFVVGYVKNPGRYDFMQGMTLMHAISVAGGVLRPSAPAVQAAGDAAKFFIAREDREGMVEQASAEALSPLCPGDLVRIMQPDQ